MEVDVAAAAVRVDLPSAPLQSRRSFGVKVQIPTGGDYDDVEAGVEAVELGYLAVVGAAGLLDYIVTEVAVDAVGTDDE